MKQNQHQALAPREQRTSRHPRSQPAVWTTRPFAAFILTTFSGGSEARSLAPAERERRSPSLRAWRRLEPNQGWQLWRSRQSRHTHAGTEQPQAGLPKLAPNELFFRAAKLNNREESLGNDAAQQPAEFKPGAALRAAPCHAPAPSNITQGMK